MPWCQDFERIAFASKVLAPPCASCGITHVSWQVLQQARELFDCAILCPAAKLMQDMETEARRLVMAAIQVKASLLKVSLKVSSECLTLKVSPKLSLKVSHDDGLWCYRKREPGRRASGRRS